MSRILGPDGMSRPNRTQEVSRFQDKLRFVLTDHETRLNALAAQQVHLAIMVEYLTKELVEVLPDFELDNKEFSEYRDQRFEEMKQEAIDLQEARTQARRAAEIIRKGGTPVDLDLSEAGDLKRELPDE
tara:strand:- start:15 stop:401 length:387 start_codon:yes stop_codon:yes gene_type:complete